MKRIIGGQPVDIDLDRILEALEQHLNDVNGAIASIRRIKSWSTPPEVAGVQTVVNLDSSLDPTGIGAGEPLWSAAYAILQNAGQPKTLVELAGILRESGVVTQSQDFQNTLNSVLTKRQSIFKRVAPKVWGLVEWFPDAEGTDIPTSSPKANVVPFRGVKANGKAR